MSQLTIYTQDGKKSGSMDVNAAIFGVKVKPTVVHEVLMAQQANARKPIANTKTKGEVRGGGKKPWKQKGTGRARQGSIRNPQWIGGGITFGPRAERDYTVKVNRRLRQNALFMALSDKVASGTLYALESFSPKEVKTKYAAELLQKLPVERRALLIVPASNPELLRMVRNLPNAKMTTVRSVNLADVLQYPTVIFWKDAVKAFEAMYPKA